MNGTVFLVAWVSAIAAGMLIGSAKGRMGTALTLTIILGWIGVLILAFIPVSDAKKIEHRRHQLWIEQQARGDGSGGTPPGAGSPQPSLPELPRGPHTTEEVEAFYRNRAS